MTSSSVKRIRLGVIVFYLLLFAGLALYDERPDPDMAAEMNRPLPAFAGRGNAYIALIGFEAPLGKRPYDIGQDTLQEMKKAFAAGTNPGEYLSPFVISRETLTFKGERPAVYDRKNKGILDYVSAHQADAAKLIGENKELLRRYKALFSYTEYHEPLDYGPYLPFVRISAVRSTQILYLVEEAARARRGDIGGALAGLRSDMEFWRMVARDSSTLLSKLISIAMVRTDILFAAELGAVGTLRAEETALLRKILEPFDSGETELAATFKGEARYMYKVAALSMKLNPGFMDRLLYKRNATDNRMYSRIRDMVKIAGLAPDIFAKEVRAIEAEREDQHRIGLPFLYNPAGEMLVLIGSGQGWHRYIEKGYNLEGLRRLALLKVLAKKEQVRPERMQQFLDARSGEFKDPYTDGPMKWDAKQGCIYFKYATGDSRVVLFL
jgi:hypothetical protein